MGSTAKQNSKPQVDALWFVARAAVLKGPFTSEQLEEKVKAKEISFLDYCWRQGFREWRPIGSVEGFDRRGRLRALPDYPLVDVPSGQEVAKLKLVDAKPDPVSKRKSFEITLARGRRHSITIYEWGAAAIFAIILAYFGSIFSVQNFARDVDHMILLSFEAGSYASVGAVNDRAISTNFIDPLLSAPGMTASNGVPTKGQVQRSPASFVSGSAQVDGLSLSREWHVAHQGFDPVYRRPFQMNGLLQVQPSGKAKIFVREVGEPYISDQNSK